MLEYIDLVLDTENLRVATILFSDAPTLRVLPSLEVAEAHLHGLLAPLGKVRGQPLADLYLEVWNRASKLYGQGNDEHPAPKLTNLMTLSSWEKVLLRQGGYEKVTRPQVLSLVENMRAWSECRGFELLLISDAELDAHPILARQARAYETIARIGPRLVVARTWDLLPWVSQDEQVSLTVDKLLKDLRDLACRPDWDYYLEWARKEKRPSDAARR
jgi:hypothetical protein